MLTPEYGPCDTWDPIYCCTFPTGSEEITGYALQAATEVLWAESGRVFGLCERTVRPCRRECNGGNWGAGSWWQWTTGYGGVWPQPWLYRGNWYNLTCSGGCGDTCSCVEVSEAILPGPVHAVTQVLLHGSVMSTGSYRVDNDQLLVRTDGGVWPWCQDMTQPNDGADAWAVTAQFGQPVPVIGQQAVGELACEITKACRGLECRLPPNVQTAARQGVTLQFSDPNDIAERLYFVGLFIKAYNPLRLRGRARAYDVDSPRWRRTDTAGY